MCGKGFYLKNFRMGEEQVTSKIMNRDAGILVRKLFYQFKVCGGFWCGIKELISEKVLLRSILKNVTQVRRKCMMFLQYV